MITKIILAGIIVFFSLNIPFVKAAEKDCSYDEQLRLREIVGKLSFSYELIDYGKAHLYDVYISGFTKDIYAFVEGGNTDFYYEEGRITKGIAFKPGENHKLIFLATEDTLCPDYRIMSRYITIPDYNPYSKHHLCVGHETYSLCQINSSIYKEIKDIVEFELRMNAYLKSLENQDKDYLKPVIEDKDEDLLFFVWDFLGKYYMPILVTIIISGSLGIAYLEIKKRKEIL